MSLFEGANWAILGEVGTIWGELPLSEGGIGANWAKLAPLKGGFEPILTMLTPSKGGDGPVRWIYGQKCPKTCVLPVGLEVSMSTWGLQVAEALSSPKHPTETFI